MLPVQRLFLGLSAANGLKIYGSDVKDAYAHSDKPIVATYLAIDDAYSDWYFKKHATRDKSKMGFTGSALIARTSRKWENVDEAN